FFRRADELTQGAQRSSTEPPPSFYIAGVKCWAQPNVALICAVAAYIATVVTGLAFTCQTTTAFQTPFAVERALCDLTTESGSGASRREMRHGASMLASAALVLGLAACSSAPDG